jgi:zinc/manganese transport system substrate-binding protein
MRTRHPQHSILAIACATTLLSAFGAHAKINIVSSIPDLGALAREIGGEHVDVRVLASPRQDPHYVDPRPSLILALSRADLLIVNGIDLEMSWLQPLLVSARNADIQIGAPAYFDASTSIELLQVPMQRIDRAMGDLHPGGNPHFNFDPRRMAKVAVALAERLAQRDAEHAAHYRTRAAALAEKLTRFADDTRARFANLAPEKRKIVPYHQSLAYLSDWLMLNEVVNVEPRPGIPPDPGHVARVLSTMKQTGTTCVVQEEFYPTNVSKTLVELAKGKLVVLPGGTRFDDGQDYLTHMKEVSDALFVALAS